MTFFSSKAPSLTSPALALALARNKEKKNDFLIKKKPSKEEWTLNKLASRTDGLTYNHICIVYEQTFGSVDKIVVTPEVAFSLKTT